MDEVNILNSVMSSYCLSLTAQVPFTTLQYKREGVQPQRSVLYFILQLTQQAMFLSMTHCWLDQLSIIGVFGVSSSLPTWHIMLIILRSFPWPSFVARRERDSHSGKGDIHPGRYSIVGEATRN